MAEIDEKAVQARINGERIRVLGNMAAQTETPRQLWWLSFADEKFRGAIIVAATEFLEALMVVNLLGVNPGGEVRGLPVPDEGIDLIPARWKNRLLNREECEAFDAEMFALREQKG